MTRTSLHTLAWATVLPVLLLVLSASEDSFGQQQAQADTVLLGGKIVTVDGQDRVAEALAIGRGRILAVGSDLAVKKHIGQKTHVIDLQGRTVIPGIVQTHSHAIGAARRGMTGGGAREAHTGQGQGRPAHGRARGGGDRRQRESIQVSEGRGEDRLGP